MGGIMTVTLLLGLAVGISGCTLAYQPPLDIPAAPYVFQGTGGAFDPIRIEDATDPETVIPSRGGTSRSRPNCPNTGPRWRPPSSGNSQRMGFALQRMLQK